MEQKPVLDTNTDTINGRLEFLMLVISGNFGTKEQ
jgi:hypothetical protein